MMTCGLGANGDVTMSMSCGGCPMIANSVAFCARRASSASRLHTESFSVNPECMRQNLAMNFGAKYMAVLIRVMSSLPWRMPFMAASVCAASSSWCCTVCV